jgi:sugar fermentation stimulation protein A
MENNLNPNVSFPRSLTRAIFLERPNRFIIQCQLEHSNEIITAHLADPGRLKELLLPGTIVWLLKNDNPKRKTQWSAILCENLDKTGFVSINTTYPNKLIENALRMGALEEFQEWVFKKSEYTLGDSRWDFLLENEEGKQLLLEVKSVTLAQGEKGMFPDAVTARGTKHVNELKAYNKYPNYESAILFVAQREDIQYIAPAEHIDAKFAQALREAFTSGVKIFGRNCRISVEGIEIGKRIPIILNEKTP